MCPISGFIPAHAGNTLRVFSGGAYSRVHPRSRGEYRPPGTSKRPITGSPPLTRGIQNRSVLNGCSCRFTPAHAGNTTGVYWVSLSHKVHPRSRGEYPAEEDPERFWQGSPPLTRGILPGRRQIQSGLRFTPAHAGNTWKVGRWNKPGLVHPRSRGEYLPLIRWRAREIGSPPLTRGIPLR